MEAHIQIVFKLEANCNQIGFHNIRVVMMIAYEH